MEPTSRVASAAGTIKDIEMREMAVGIDASAAIHSGREYSRRSKRACVDGEDSCYTSTETREENRPKHIRVADGSHERLCLLASTAEYLEATISSTARSGHHRLVEDEDSEYSDVDADGSTVSKGPGNTDDTVEKTLMSVVRKNQPIELSEFLRGHEISSQLRGRAVIRAATTCNELMVRQLLASGAIAQEDRELALIRATNRGATNIVRALLTSGSISRGVRGTALVRAATKGGSGIVEQLLTNGEISQKDREEAVIEAAKDWSKKPVQVLRDLSLIPSTKQPSKKPLQMLLEDMPISEEVQDKARSILIASINAPTITDTPTVEDRLMLMARDNLPDVLSTFLNEHEISISLRGRVVIFAAMKGLTDVCRRLLASGPISDTDRELALIRAANRLATGIIKMLRANGPISIEVQDEATRLLNAHGKAIATMDKSSNEDS